ncbi:MAG: DNA alkylation repair protein [Kiritimatiellae bacterium]|nr:DNA alkylation repair protein [Kiritimatiellia bacterium]
MNATDVRERVLALGDPERARISQGFFKTGPGEYGEGDVFAGVRVPVLRKLACECRALPAEGMIRLLRDPVHEVRLLALLLMVQAYRQGEAGAQERIYRAYLQHTRFINNWDLVDASAEHIVGAWLSGRDKGPLVVLANSPCLWERRIAIVATFYFIRRGDFSATLRVAEQSLHDTEDLIHKASGWMLREVGKREQKVLEAFLKKHGKRMPRTMLRYAIERFPEPLRLGYLRGARMDGHS